MVSSLFRAGALLSALLAFSQTVTAVQFPRPVPPELPASAAALELTGNFTFTQLLDHDDPSLGTFQQRVWWSDEFWKGPGSPVIFFTPGEIEASRYTGYLTNRTLTGLLAQTVGGAVVMVEHRYWGGSSPYQTLTTKNLQYLTLKNSIADFVYLARNIELPFDPTHSSQAPKAPWVYMGGSYSGALSAWTESTSPGTFWAYHSSSAPVEAVYDYWQYFTPVQQGMPHNCSTDVSRVINYIDKVFKHGSPKEQLHLKNKFGLATIPNDDFGATIEYGPWYWQSNTFYSNYSSFYQFCDTIEGVQAGAIVTPGPDGVGLEKALEGYAYWTKEVLLPKFCQGFGYNDTYDLSCLNTHDKNNKIFTDWTVYNVIDRQWQWMLCNEPFGYWQDGAPQGTPSIVSRLVDAHYWRRQCDIFFPPEGPYTFGYNKGKTESQLNRITEGWDLTNTKRLTWTNGQFDPWRTSSVSSEFRPGGPLKSTPQAPVNVIPGGFHCSDLILKNAEFNSGVKKVVDTEIATLKGWVEEFYHKK